MMYDVANVVDTVVSNLSLEYQNWNDNLDTDDFSELSIMEEDEHWSGAWGRSNELEALEPWTKIDSTPTSEPCFNDVYTVVGM